MYTNPKIVIIDKINEKTEFFCKLCKFPLKHRDDFESQKNFDCCHECYLTYAEGRIKDWKEGWRPDKETLEEYIYKRRSVLINQEIK